MYYLVIIFFNVYLFNIFIYVLPHRVQFAKKIVFVCFKLNFWIKRYDCSRVFYFSDKPHVFCFVLIRSTSLFLHVRNNLFIYIYIKNRLRCSSNQFISILGFYLFQSGFYASPGSLIHHVYLCVCLSMCTCAWIVF